MPRYTAQYVSLCFVSILRNRRERERERERERDVVIWVEWGSNYVFLSGGQQRTNGVRFISCKESLFLIFKTNIPLSEQLKFWKSVSYDAAVVSALAV
jgi:hypothetical protein